MSNDTFWEQYSHFLGCTVRESNSAVGVVTGVTNANGPKLHIRRRNGKIDLRRPSDVHKTCACGKRALGSDGEPCPGHENCKPLASAPPEPEDCREPHEAGPLNYCSTCSWQREPRKATEAKLLVDNLRRDLALLERHCRESGPNKWGVDADDMLWRIVVDMREAADALEAQDREIARLRKRTFNPLTQEHTI